MYTIIRKYYIVPGSWPELKRHVQTDLVPLISQAAGFIAYDVRDVGNDRVRTISTFDSRAGAKESVLLALRWAQERG